MRSGFAPRSGRVSCTSAAQAVVDGDLRRDRRACDNRRPHHRFAHLAHPHRRGATGQEMTTTKADQIVDKAAARLQELADRAAAEGGAKAKLAKPLADDAAFLRKLKPSLIAKRIKGEAPTNQKPAEGTVAPSSPQLGKRKPP